MTQTVGGPPTPYVTVHPVDDRTLHANLFRLSTADIGAWGTRERNPGEPPRTYIIMSWGWGFDVTETLAQIDAFMGYTGP